MGDDRLSGALFSRRQDLQQATPFVCRNRFAKAVHLAVPDVNLRFEQARENFERDWKASGKKLNVGKACIRFKNVESAPLDVIQKALSQVTVEEYVERYLEVRGSARKMKK